MELPNNLLEGSKEFLNSNSFISKISFIILIIIVFILLFNFLYWIMNMILTPSNSPYLIDGMKDAKQMKVIPQNLNAKGAIPIYRSKDQYNGIEMTWSTWIYIDDPTYKQTGLGATEVTIMPVFVKGSNSKSNQMDVLSTDNTQTFTGSNGPGVYLLPNRALNSESYETDSYYNSVTMNMDIHIDIYPYKDINSNTIIYKQKITIENIPIRKWVSVIIRCSTQNIVDVFINGSLQKRVKLYNIIRQNYSDVYVNPEGGFSGFLSNLKYYNYSIGTFEINQIVSAGPNLNMEDNSNIKSSNPYYLSTKWLFGETNVS